MARSPRTNENNMGLKKGPWTPEEDEALTEYIRRHGGHGNWRGLPKLAGLNRCGKSCRLRWTNYLRPDIKRGSFSPQEEQVIIHLHSLLGNKWSRIAGQLPGRTDNEIKNFWITQLRKKLLHMGIDPTTHLPRTDLNHLLTLSQQLCPTNIPNLMNPNLDINALRLQADAAQLAKIQLLQNLLQVIQNPNLPGTQNLNPLYETQEFLNLGASPQSTSGSQDLAASWACFNGGFSDEVDVNNYNERLNSSCGIQAVNPIPGLVSAASVENSSVYEILESTSKLSYVCEQSPTSTIFEAWEKLMDDESSGSYWKDILDLTSG